jgi:ankyrin repeat protein
MQWMGLGLPDEALMNEDALVHAVRHRYVAMTKWFLQGLMLDAGIGAQRIVSPWLLSLGSLCTALYHAIDQGDEDIVELLLERGADANTIFNPLVRISPPVTPLTLALTRGFPGIAEQLLDHGANPNLLMTSPDVGMLAWVARNRYDSLVFKMLRNRVHPNPYGVQPLTMAIWARSPVIVKTLLEFGADPNIDKQFWSSIGKIRYCFGSVLPYARRMGNQDIVDTLKQYGAVESWSQVLTRPS